MKRVLVVDDDPLSLKVLSRHLTQHGYRVCTGASGVEGLRLFAQEQPDVVVSDVVMPEMDGFEFCRQLRQQRGGELVPFIFLSSRGEVDDRVQGYEWGADDYIIKPFEPLELVAKIEAQIERSRRTQSEILRLIQQQPQAKPEVVAPRPTPAELPLTAAEERVFREVIRGSTNKQIGEKLFISPRTVQTHLTNILSKLSLENRSQLVRFAYERGYSAEEEPAE
ncbi:response regulator transcription factor [Synechococcus sp. Nb3U1]|uniref:response regulator transcription factor n=1 Tax=Synechococcus sp. Nb3U1 TaxID=1914529 RepID=UPI001F415C64|nr:response regulator transcription factor [Synechococcus sp. Nb3U1]MCF2972644.1 response regulator transcription factor [Synechococcus sp. Nb3U1]